jgi:FKBP-type peptidyl-prolyl cis-trans isomerase (trigger factor)
MAEATIGSLANLATATAADRGVVATLTEANARLVKQLEDNSNELRELKALIKKEIFEKVDNAVLIRHQTIIAGLMATKSPILTPV